MNICASLIVTSNSLSSLWNNRYSINKGARQLFVSCDLYARMCISIIQDIVTPNKWKIQFSIFTFFLSKRAAVVMQRCLLYRIDRSSGDQVLSCNGIVLYGMITMGYSTQSLSVYPRLCCERNKKPPLSLRRCEN